MQELRSVLQQQTSNNAATKQEVQAVQSEVAQVKAATAKSSSVTIPGMPNWGLTITGALKAGVQSLSYSQSTKANTSQTGVVADPSRIVFGARRELGGWGGGLAAIGQVDLRFGIDSGNITGVTGNSHIGLDSKSYGRLIFGRQDLHWFNTESKLGIPGALAADSASILSFAGGGSKTIANGTRTPNVVHYRTPNWGGFALIAAYSSSPTAAAEADIGSGVRKGSGINLNPNMAGKNYQIGYSYWNAKPDGVAAVDQRSDRLYGSYSWDGFKLGLAWDRSKLTTAATGVRTSDRTAWSLPAEYKWGKHGIYAHYTVARNDTATAGADGAKMVALAYAYEFYKDTSVALTYTKITNDAAAIYQPFASGTGGLGQGTGAIAAGEDPTIFALTLRYSF